MFADIEESSQRKSHGKSQSRELLKNSYEVLRAELPSFRARELKTTGNGLMATLDGPAWAIRFACSSA